MSKHQIPEDGIQISIRKVANVGRQKIMTVIPALIPKFFFDLPLNNS